MEKEHAQIIRDRYGTLDNMVESLGGDSEPPGFDHQVLVGDMESRTGGRKMPALFRWEPMRGIDPQEYSGGDLTEH